MIIDTHAHIFPGKIAEKAVASIGNFYDLPMYGNGQMESLIATGYEAGVNAFIVNSSATAKHQVDGINDFILNSIKGRQNVWGLCTLHQDMTADEIDKTISWAIENGLIGIKLHPDFQHFFIDDPAVYKIYESASGRLPILFHTGDSRYEYSRPFRLRNIAVKFPDLMCVGAHFGGYDRWEEIDCYKGLDNVFFDTSSSLFKMPKELALSILNKLGIEKFMFGVDYPMWNHSYEVDNINKLKLSDNEKEMIFYKNALNFYKIKPL